ncbi:MAG: DegT/DnrJ/EryC1/StrS family aminotransferase [Planctomycetaceae bacterium]|nr:DegT/DnrJ/EryC1/StrS family aminotransferase [Planctomycetaceae bacterium]
MSTPLPALLGGQPVRPRPPVWPPVDDWVVASFQELVSSGAWGRYHGPYAEQVRTLLRDMHSGAHIALTCSGSMANELALRALHLPAGSEVVLAGYDYKPNFTTIVHLGLRPVLVDIDPASAQMQVDLALDAINAQTGAILVSHLQGGLVDLPRLVPAAAERGIPIIEDCCQQLGGQLAGRPTGTWGDISTLSFGGSKQITAGRGGALITARDDLAQRLTLEMQRGNDIYPLSELQCALIVPQLQQLAQRREQRQLIVEQMGSELASHCGLTPFAIPDRGATPDYYKLGCWYRPQQWYGLSADRFCEFMQAEGIPFAPGFQALHRIHARRRFRVHGELPNSEQAEHQVVALHHPFLSEPNAVKELLEALEKIRTHARSSAES